MQLHCIVLWTDVNVCCRKEHDKCEFDVHEVYGIDVLVSTGEGKVVLAGRMTLPASILRL